jgi:2-(1,2-epoxy-1,2-dihydrophenyl)acetyl-CoA isomerase
MSDEAPLLTDVRDGVARLTFNRPDAGNALDLPMARALLHAAMECDRDPAVRCVVLTGAGRMFCAGGDIAGFQAAGDRADAFLSELAGTMTLALSRLARMAKPLLVLVNGAAAGAGLSIALAGDIVLATPSAHFTSAYTAIGLVPDCGLTWWLPRVVGYRRAQEMMVTNRRVGAEEAAKIGIVTRLADDLQIAGDEAAAMLAASPVRAVGAVRRLLLDSFANSLETQGELEARAISAAGVGPEGREGVAAFLVKRKPDFTGV